MRIQSTWGTGEQGTLDTSAVLVYGDSIIVYERTVENTEYMENWRTRNTGHISSTRLSI